MAIVTKDSLVRMLADPAKRGHVIGRALVALFDRNQTSSEQAANQTQFHNNIGFSGSDARWLPAHLQVRQAAQCYRRGKGESVMRVALLLVVALLAGCTVQDGALRVDLVCNRTIVGRDGLHYTRDQLEHIHCNKRMPLMVSYNFGG